MRVTDEMVERAAPWTQGSRHIARTALEAALADVPEPEPGICVTLDERELWVMETDRADAAEARVAELEAKLEKVRAWCESHLLERAFQDGLGAIFEEQP